MSQDIEEVKIHAVDETSEKRKKNRSRQRGHDGRKSGKDGKVHRGIPE